MSPTTYQQIVAEILVDVVLNVFSTTGSVEPSPCPQINLSHAVGMSFRCLATKPSTGSTKMAVQYRVPPSRSMIPTTKKISNVELIFSIAVSAGEGRSIAAL